MSLLCFCAGIICLAYYLLIVVYAGITADFAWIWLVLAAILEGGAVLIRYGKIIPVFPRMGEICSISSGAAGNRVLCSTLQPCGFRYENISPGKSGLCGSAWRHVKGDVPSKALELRLKAALKYARENEDTILVLSGGQGFGEDITEAECMENYLTAHGISRERLVLEEKSTNTKENLKFSDALTGCSQKNTGILSNNFHVYRAVKIAEKAGYEHPYGIAAPSDPIMQVHYVVREAAALIKAKIYGNI